MEVVSTIVGKVVDFLFGAAKEEITLMRNCSQNVEKLKHEVEKLSSMKGRVQQQIDLARSKGEPLLEGVEEWVKKVDDKISEAREFIAQEAEAKKTCFNLRFCVNLSALRHYSKSSIKKTSFLLRHQEDGKAFETCVSLPARSTPTFVDLYQSKNLENIDTQKSTLKKIIEAIEDDTIQIIGINGLGGVGKTTLASEAAVKMKSQFPDIVFVPVSQNIDAKRIQEKVQVAAGRIMNGEKVLIILDDVWKELKLDEMGIPCGSDKMNCKVLLTSRSKDVCEAMNVQKNFTVKPLEDVEALTLFERVVGRSEWDNTWKEVALKIVEECGGLPLFIQAVGKALRNKEFKIWEAALGRLQKPTNEDVPFKREGITQLKLSYDYLESEIAKSCFLLCSLFPEDGKIGLKRLTYYGFALGIFNNPDCNIQDAKEVVQLVVDSLKSSFLLLPTEIDFYDPFKKDEREVIKMHDLVRDMAMLITSKGDDKCWVKSGIGLEEWQPQEHLKSYRKISLMENRICELPDHDFVFQQLDTFLVQGNAISVIPDEFFRGMEKLKVLDMSRNNISSLPRSLKQLTKLCMLDLSVNYSLHEISTLGEATCLEILKLRWTGIKNIPEEIGKLNKLRLLDVLFCEDLSYVTPGVISKLISLEELYIGIYKEGSYEFLMEVGEPLKILHLVVPKLHYIPDNTYFQGLPEFDLYLIGSIKQLSTTEKLTIIKHPSSLRKRLGIESCSFPFTMPVMKLIKVSEVLELLDIKDLDNILPDLCQEGFDELKYIKLMDCDNVRSLVKTSDLDAFGTQRTSKGKFFSQLEEIELLGMNNLKVLWDSPHRYISFCNLMSITITNCPSLTELFPECVARGLINLRDLYIHDCESLVVVISSRDEKTTGSKTKLDFKLPVTHIYLRRLPKLESFYSGHSVTKYPSLKFMYVNSCESIQRWSYGDNHIPNLDLHYHGRLYSNINDYIAVNLERNGSFEIDYMESSFDAGDDQRLTSELYASMTSGRMRMKFVLMVNRPRLAQDGSQWTTKNGDSSDINNSSSSS